MNTQPPEAVAAPCAEMVLVGGCGDLALSKLMPALLHLESQKQLANELKIYSSCRSTEQARHYHQLVKEELWLQNERPVESSLWRTFSERIFPFLMKAKADSTKQADSDCHLETESKSKSGSETYDLPERRCRSHVRLFYLAIPPTELVAVINQFFESGALAATDYLVLEKPLGTSLAKARDIYALATKRVKPDHVLVHHHYACKPVIHELLQIRASNPLIEKNWNHQSIQSVTIEVLEKSGINGRVDYYAQSGALIDMVQSQLLQLVALFAMDLPTKLTTIRINQNKLKVLRSLIPLDEASVRKTKRGQYISNPKSGVLGFEDELEATGTDCESYVEITTRLNLSRWRGVPFVLRTGKRMAQNRSEIRVKFKKGIIKEYGQPDGNDNQLSEMIIRLSPKPLIILRNNAQERLFSSPIDENKTCGLSYPSMLLKALQGSSECAIPMEQIEASWQWTEQVKRHWLKGAEHIDRYVAGSIERIE